MKKKLTSIDITDDVRALIQLVDALKDENTRWRERIKLLEARAESAVKALEGR